MTDVRVGIVSWNTASLLDRCLAALPAALGGLDAEVVVVDNASDDSSAAVVRSHPWVRLVENTDNVGYARAMNQALAGTTAPVLVALNPDTAPPPGSLATLVERLHAHPETGLVVPRLMNEDGSLQHSVYRFPTVAVAMSVSFTPRRVRHRGLGARMWLEGFSPHDEAGEVDWAIGAVHVIRRAALDGASPYSERWFMYVEDIELCWRLGTQGWTVRLEPDVEVPHVGNAAGAQAWGATRAARYWAASYDFVAGARGPSAARRLAAVNVLGCTVHGGGNRVASWFGGPNRQRRRTVGAQLLRLVPLHARAFLNPQESFKD